MLTVHHLRKSQSERIVWLCEELGLDYTLKAYDREPVTLLAPAALKALHPMGAAPVIDDDGVVLAESGAIVDWLIARRGDGRLALPPSDPHFADYLYWLHFANGNLQPAMGRNLLLNRLPLPADEPTVVATRERLARMVGFVDARLADAPYLAGPRFTAADVMTVFSLTTMRLAQPLDLTPFPNIRRYLLQIGDRPAYRRALALGDPGMAPLLE